jgi:putative restriction endonuclease
MEGSGDTAAVGPTPTPTPVAVCEPVADRFFGELPGVPVGSAWETRLEASRAGVHRPTVPGISGTKAEGADSIVVSGGYEDDEDRGDEIIYTGAGGNHPGTGKQIADQSIDQSGNAGLVTSQNQGLPVRVIRGAKGDPVYSPATGYRYDGLYRVADHWSEVGKSGYRIWRFQLLRLSEQEAAPYTPDVNLPPGNPKPKKSTGVMTRIVRDTKVSRGVKKLYEDRCQVCDLRLAIPGGSVSEGAHIQALGGVHQGPDVPENVLCLCPNHHTLFDEGGIYVADDLTVLDYEGQTVGVLTKHPKHAIGMEYVKSHRERWGY